MCKTMSHFIEQFEGHLSMEKKSQFYENQFFKTIIDIIKKKPSKVGPRCGAMSLGTIITNCT